jgi:hypothetical protein
MSNDYGFSFTCSKFKGTFSAATDFVQPSILKLTGYYVKYVALGALPPIIALHEVGIAFWTKNCMQHVMCPFHRPFPLKWGDQVVHGFDCHALEGIRSVFLVCKSVCHKNGTWTCPITLIWSCWWINQYGSWAKDMYWQHSKSVHGISNPGDNKCCQALPGILVKWHPRLRFERLSYSSTCYGEDCDADCCTLIGIQGGIASVPY